MSLNRFKNFLQASGSTFISSLLLLILFLLSALLLTTAFAQKSDDIKLPDLGSPEINTATLKPNISMNGGGFNYRNQSNNSLITLSPQYSQQTGFSIGGVYARPFSDIGALGIILNAGSNRNEWLVNAGYEINQNQRVIFSLGQIRQNLEFNFQSGADKTQITQNNGALSYQYLLGKSLLNSAEFNAFISDTPSINLSDKTWFTNTASLYELWNDPRRIAGAKVQGIQSKLVLTPSSRTTVKLGLGAEYLSYDLLLGKDSFTRATGSAEFNQRLESGFNLNASANLAASQNKFGLGLSRNFKDGQKLSIDALAIRGRDNTFDDNLLTFNFTQTFGGVNSSITNLSIQDAEIKSATPNPPQKDLANNDVNSKATWISDILNAVAKRPSFLPSQVNAKIDTTAASTRLIAIDKTGIPNGSTIENATGILTVPIGTAVNNISAVTKNVGAFTNNGQFTLSGNNLTIDPSILSQPAEGTIDTYVVTMHNSVNDGSTTLATITVSHGSRKIDSVVITPGTIPTVLRDFISNNSLFLSATSCVSSCTPQTYNPSSVTRQLLPPSSNNPAGSFSYSSSNSSVATVDSSSGLITIISAGSTTLTATQAASGNYTTATTDAKFTVTPASTSLTGFALSSNSVALGASAPTITAPTSSRSGTITYTSSNPSIATIDPNTGVIAIIAIGGPVIFTATQVASANYVEGTATTSLTVVAPTIISGVISGITPPATGATPVYSVSGTGYTGSVSWQPSVVGTFAAGITYEATITITPTAGYTLTGVAPNAFTVSGTSSSATNSANSGVITAPFPATNAPGFFKVDGVTSTPPSVGGFIRYPEALAYCSSLATDNKTWRLPTFAELLALDYSLINAGFNGTSNKPTGWSIVSQTWSSDYAGSNKYRTLYMTVNPPDLTDVRNNTSENAVTLCVTSE